jgi:hypothetical protein
MTYPPNSGYPPSQQPTTQFSAPTQGFGKVEQTSTPGGSQTPAATTAAAGPSKLPFFLLAGVAALGLLVYLFSFGDVFTIESTDFPQMGSASGTSQGVVMAVVAALVAGLIAAASLLPKQRAPIGVIAAVSVLSFLLTLAEIIQKPEGVSIGWALYALIVLTFLQSAVSVGALLFDAGIVKAPAPKPKYEQQQQPSYGPYGQPSQYYGQHTGQQVPHQGAAQQRPQYPGQGQYGGGYSGGSSASGGFAPIGQQGGPPTPPTGFPTYSQPQSSQSAPSGQSQPAPQSSGSSSSSSNQSGNSSS